MPPEPVVLVVVSGRVRLVGVDVAVVLFGVSLSRVVSMMSGQWALTKW
jgi:hypothetical protein